MRTAKKLVMGFYVLKAMLWPEVSRADNAHDANQVITDIGEVIEEASAQMYQSGAGKFGGAESFSVLLRPTVSTPSSYIDSPDEAGVAYVKLGEQGHTVQRLGVFSREQLLDQLNATLNEVEGGLRMNTHVIARMRTEHTTSAVWEPYSGSPADGGRWLSPDASELEDIRPSDVRLRRLTEVSDITITDYIYAEDPTAVDNAMSQLWHGPWRGMHEVINSDGTTWRAFASEPDANEGSEIHNPFVRAMAFGLGKQPGSNGRQLRIIASGGLRLVDGSAMLVQDQLSQVGHSLEAPHLLKASFLRRVLRILPQKTTTNPR